MGSVRKRTEPSREKEKEKLTVFREKKVHELRGEVITNKTDMFRYHVWWSGKGMHKPELPQCIVQLLSINGSGTVPIEVTIDVLPVLDILPKSGELRSQVISSDTPHKAPRNNQRTSLKPIVPLRSVSLLVDQPSKFGSV